MKNYKVIYRKRGNKGGQLYETMTSADNRREAIELSRLDLGEEYTIVKVLLER